MCTFARVAWSSCCMLFSSQPDLERNGTVKIVNTPWCQGSGIVRTGRRKHTSGYIANQPDFCTPFATPAHVLIDVQPRRLDDRARNWTARKRGAKGQSV